MGKLAILHADGLGEWEENLVCLSNHLGVDTMQVCVCSRNLTAQQLRNSLSEAQAIAVSAATLCVLEEGELHLSDLYGEGENTFARVLIFGYQPDARHVDLARKLTGNAIVGIEPIPSAATCSFPRAGKAHSGQLAGCDFERDPGPSDVCFHLEARTGIETLMELEHKPAFVCSVLGTIPCFHWAGVETIANPSARIQEDLLARQCDRFVPPIMFLRAAFGSACWDNPVKTARVIIDDPLLESRYGFLHYDDLVKSLANLRYGATTAFIPWNHHRTRLRMAHFFSQHYPAHSVCVHGCDHTNNEFGTTNQDILTQKGLLALQRMDKHRQRTGLAYDPVMVFPQGRFSTGAIRALRLSGFLAVVNSTRIPIDSSDIGLTLKEELLPATNYLSGLPLFMRRYPRQMSAYALDLFLGKPAHVVEHHDWFARGLGELHRCVEFLQEAEPGLVWPSLSDALRQHHLQRHANKGIREIRFFTPWFEFENPEPYSLSVAFSKSEPEPDLVESVTIGGQRVPFVRENGQIVFQKEMLPKQRIEIRVNAVVPSAAKAWHPGIRYRASVSVRRRLSELRDNHLVRHPVLLRAGKKIVRPWSSYTKPRK